MSGRANTTRTGFTLVELLVVIGIIALLVGILAPFISKAMLQGEMVRVRTWVNDLANATIAYSRDNNDVYPGQDLPAGVLDGNTNNNAYSGSQYLSRALFGIVTTNPFTYPTATKYMQSGSEDLIDPSTNKTAATDNFQWKTISDRTNNPMPVLYYPARPGMAALNQYVYEDNKLVSDSYGATDTGFYDFILDKKYWYDPANLSTIKATGTPRNPRGFLLIAAGADGQYFTGDDIRYPAWTR